MNDLHQCELPAEDNYWTCPECSSSHNLFTLLSLFDFDNIVDLWWRTDEGVISFYVRVDELFGWADYSEEIRPADLKDLAAAKHDMALLEDGYNWPELWVSRKRHMRPMRLWLRECLRTVTARELFMAAGPERDPDPEG